MKYILVIPDGAADQPCEKLGGKTPLQAANIPAMRALAKEGTIGLSANVPEGCAPGSDIACLSLLGYDPRVGYTGRAALEAAARDLQFPDDAAVFRANMVTVENGVMRDYSAGHITNDEAYEIVDRLREDMAIDGVSLFPGIGYRHLCVIESMAGQVPKCTPPHDIMGKPVDEYAPVGGFSSWVLEIERTSRTLMADYAVNKKRIKEGHLPATQLWLWGGSTAAHFEKFSDRFGIQAGLISAVDLLRGIGKLTGMDILDVPGATGYYDTNYAGKGSAALEYISGHDFVVVHVEASDEAGHNGDVAAKVKALEDIDKHILAPLYAKAKKEGDWRILVSPDHPTPLSLRTHTADPVPYIMWGPGIAASGAGEYSEAEAKRLGGAATPGDDLLRLLFAKS